MKSKYNLEPVAVQRVNTKYRRIKTKLPVPESLPIFESAMDSEPESKRGQPPVVWDKAEGFQVYDKWGNKWIDFSSGVLVANVGHGRKEIVNAMKKVMDRGLLTTFAFVHENRMKLTRELQ